MMNRGSCILLFLSVWSARPSFAAERIFHTSAAGIAADGATPVTAPLQKLLDVASTAGPATVYLDPGQYLTGSLFIRSHTRLVIASGATIVGTTDATAYPAVQTRAAGVEMKWPAALLNVEGATNVSIEGTGTIDGNGKTWWDAFWKQVPAYESRGLRWAVDYDVQRPELIRIYNSTSVHVGRGLLLRRSAFWTVHICYSKHVTVSQVTIRNNDPVDGKGPSTDGIDIDSSSHVLVDNVDIANNDDAICLKAGMNADGLRVNRPTEDVVIQDSIVRQGISGIAIGSDTAGGFRNIRVSGITILSGVRFGIYLKSTHTRGGWTQTVSFSDVHMHGVQTAIKIDLNYFPAFSTPHIPKGIEKDLPPTLHDVPEYWKRLAAPVSPEKGTPHFRDITFSKVDGEGIQTAFDLNAAQDAPMEEFVLEHVHLDALHAGSIRHTAGLRMKDVQIRATDNLREEDMQRTIGAAHMVKR